MEKNIEMYDMIQDDSNSQKRPSDAHGLEVINLTKKMKIMSKNYIKKPLMPFQEVCLQEMIEWDRIFNYADIMHHNLLLTNHFGILNLKYGVGKTIVSVHRILHWLIHKENLENSDDTLSTSSINTGKYVDKFCLCKRYQKECDNQVSIKPLLRTLDEHCEIGKFYHGNNADKCLIMIPVKLKMQWLEEIKCVLGPILYAKHVAYVTNDNEKNVEILQNKRIIVISNNYEGDAIWKFNYDLCFIDEAHLIDSVWKKLNCSYNFKHISANCNFIWLVSASFKVPSYSLYLKRWSDLNIRDLVNLIFLDDDKQLDSNSMDRLTLKSANENFQQNLSKLYGYIKEFSEWLVPELKQKKLLGSKNLFRDKFLTKDIQFENANITCSEDNFIKIIQISPETKVYLFNTYEEFHLHSVASSFAKAYEDYFDFKDIELVDRINIDIIGDIRIERENRLGILLENKVYYSSIGDTMRLEKCQELEKELKEIEVRYDSICIVCFSSPEEDNNMQIIILTCCKKSICVNCIQLCLDWDKSCPHCRKKNIEKEYAEAVKKINTCDIDKQLLFKKPLTKLRTFKALSDLLVNDLKMKKILVVYDLSRKFNNFYTNSKDSIIFDGYTTARIKRFCEEEDLKFAFINSQVFNYGYNLQFADAMIFLNEFGNEDMNQMIGRAQRIGRTSTLRVYKIL
jgi:hypothetical protein